MKVACAQMNIAFAEPEKNFLTIEYFVSEAAKAGCEIIVFPEMWNTGYALGQLDIHADRNGEKTKLLLSKLSNRYQIHIVGGSVSTKKADGFYNTMFVANKTGAIVSEYDKVHLFRLMEEHLVLKPGNQKNLFDLDNIPCAGVICYDLRFPEWIRAHTLDGAKIVFIPAQWPKSRIDHWRVLLQARAIENQCYIVAVNRVGSDPSNEFNGHSMVIGPWGDILLDKQTLEGLYCVEIDLNDVNKVRQTIPIFTDRRTDLY
ncbi:carbon-nitrogen family hydrolase [Bacillus marasmi]|uniref:carbon-nitrogen family hydrolase n=1 Tax=Bacillus marasmi TaxID=1926279 RepID=UPI0011CA6373|nr:carbon-nitrogen family hydrolase [Bacillus marasmi]